MQISIKDKKIEFKDLNKNLKKELSKMDFEISNMASLNLLSRTIGFNNYNTFKSYREEMNVLNKNKDKKEYTFYLDNNLCFNCESKIDYNKMKFCPHCNYKIKTECLKCHTSILKDAYSCHYCSHIINKDLTLLEKVLINLFISLDKEINYQYDKPFFTFNIKKLKDNKMKLSFDIVNKKNGQLLKKFIDSLKQFDTSISSRDYQIFNENNNISEKNLINDINDFNTEKVDYDKVNNYIIFNNILKFDNMMNELKLLRK